MESYLLNEKQAYKAMFLFLEHLYILTNDDGLGAVLGSMQLLKDGEPIDRAHWTDWIQAIEKVIDTKPRMAS
jgi:hypothetical protein